MATESTITPNLYEVSGHGIQVSYMRTSITGEPRFHYQDAQVTLDFAGDEIGTLDGGNLGTFVTVTIKKSIDADFTTFTLIVPQINLAGAEVHFSTVGITTQHHFLASAPNLIKGPLQNYHCIHLLGAASVVEFIAGQTGQPATGAQAA